MRAASGGKGLQAFFSRRLSFKDTFKVTNLMATARLGFFVGLTEWARSDNDFAYDPDLHSYGTVDRFTDAGKAHVHHNGTVKFMGAKTREGILECYNYLLNAAPHYTLPYSASNSLPCDNSPRAIEDDNGYFRLP